MKQPTPSSSTDFDRISAVAYAEEEAFRRTLAAGTTHLRHRRRAQAQGVRRGAGARRGDQAFQLHDTYGFPIDLTLEMAAEQGVTSTRRASARLMQRAARPGQGRRPSPRGPAHANTEVWRDLRADGRDRLPRLRGPAHRGARVVGLVVDGEVGARDRAGPARPGGPRPHAVLRRVRRPGRRRGRHHRRRRAPEVVDVQRPVKGLVAHPVEVLDGAAARGRRACTPRSTPSGGSRRARRTPARTSCTRRCARCSARRRCSRARTTGPATCGSTSPGGQALSASDPQRHRGGRQRRRPPGPPGHRDLHDAAARRGRSGALALFGETYGEEVRVVEIGGPWWRELCGGTHVQHSRQIGTLALTGESSVGSGVRRVEAFVGIDALRYLARERAIVAELSGLVGARPDELAERVGAMVARLRDAERELERARRDAGPGRGRQPHRAGRATSTASRSSATTPARPAPTTCARMVLDLRGRLGADAPERRRHHRRRQGPPGRGRRDERGGALSAASGPATSCASRPAPSVAVAAARTTSRRAAARTRRRSATRSRPSSGASGSSPADAGPTAPDRAPSGGCGSVSTWAACGSGSPGATPTASSRRPSRRSPASRGRLRHPATPTSRPSPRWSREHRAVGVVVGLPRSLSGGEGPAAAAARAYAAVVAARVAPVWVRLVDERLTSVDAHRTLRDSGVAGRRQRAVVDQAAAVLILQTALDTERSTGAPPGERVRPGRRKPRTKDARQ